MKILFVGDVYGQPGRRATADLIPKLLQSHGIDFCVVNGENAAGGFGITEKIARKFRAYGADVITTGNHVWDRKDSVAYICATEEVLRPANFPPGVGGFGWGVFQSRSGVPVGVICLQGRTQLPNLDCPFRAAQSIIEEIRSQTPVVFVDFHAEATSEKIAFGWFLDGKASAVVGTHTHVQTADERVLPNGTAYITDAGMTGPHDSVIGSKKDPIIRRFLNQMPVRFEPAEGDIKLCGVIVDVDETTGKARDIQRLRVDWEEA